MAHIMVVFKRDLVSLILFYLMVMFFSANEVEALELYPRYTCKKISNYEEKPPTDTTPKNEKNI